MFAHTDSNRTARSSLGDHVSRMELICVLVGMLLWLIYALLNVSAIQTESYVRAILLAAPLLLVPLHFRVLGIKSFVFPLSLFCALALTAAYLVEPGSKALMLSLPWLMFALGLGVYRLFSPIEWTWKYWGSQIAIAFLIVGAAWAVADRAGYSPFGFDPMITLLTAVHFHYAGYVLMMTAVQLCGLNTSEKSGGILISLLAIGVLMVAAGITSEHIGLPAFVESLAVLPMVSAGIWIGALHFQLGINHRKGWYRFGWLLGGVALILGMLLAIAYGWRHYFHLPFLSIPWMYAVHGSLNSLGFALPVSLSWWAYRNSNA